MVDLGIYNYVRASLARKEDRSVIEANLARQGLDTAAIAEVIAAAEANHEPAISGELVARPEQHTLGVLAGVIVFSATLILLVAISLGAVKIPTIENLTLSRVNTTASSTSGIADTAILPFTRALLRTVAEEAEIYTNTQEIPNFGDARGCDEGMFASTRIEALLTEIRTRTGGSIACRSDATSFVLQVSLPLTRTGAPTYLCIDSTGRPASESPAPLGRGATQCF